MILALRVLPLVACALVPQESPGPVEALPFAPLPFAPLDVFELEYASSPRFAPDARHLVYVRHSMDVRSDRRRSHLWLVATDGGDHRPLFAVDGEASHPTWSPRGDRLAFVARDAEGRNQLWLRWMDTGQTARLTQLPEPPRSLAWSPDGRELAFTMHVREEPERFVKMPAKPEGAEWAPEARMITSLRYRADGAGYLEPGHVQLFVLPADGGTPRALTRGPWDVDGTPRWTPDGRWILISSNRREDAELEPLDTDVWAVPVNGGEPERRTTRYGPDRDPLPSPDGRLIAYTGFDDRHLGFQVRRLHVMNADGSEPRVLTAGLDRSVSRPRWSADGRRIFVSYDDHGVGRIAACSLGGEVVDVAEGAGGLSLGRPYGGADFDVSARGHVAYTRTDTTRPADLFVRDPDGGVRRLTALNEDLLGHRRLGEVREVRFPASFDGRELQGWLALPPGFDPDERYPLLLEIHGGPFANYGPRFAAEIQLYAAAGYVVLYMNPRGSTSYGAEFANLIHHAYPGNDYDDLMSGVDHCIELGFIDPDRLFVTGGSGGGVLSAWIVGKTDRFRAAVVAKPVIHWTSFALTADAYNVFHKYWFPGPPWEHPEHYFARSPLSLVGNVSTPTMVLTGEADFRTPISESEQFYQALKLRGVESALVRIPEASHGIAARPSHLIAKVLHVLEWFERHDRPDGPRGPRGEEGE